MLRLKGVYFIFITFIFNEILQLILFETPTLTGGSDGISALPPATLFGIDLGAPKLLVLVTVVVCLVATAVTLWVTQRFRAEFTSIEENETLAESLGVAVWKYRTIGFVASAGVSGLAGFALVNMLSTAHPSSFASWSVNSYIAYAFVGGRGTMLGIVIGSLLLIVMTNIFSAYAHLSAGLFGILLLVVMMAAPSGLVGSAIKWHEGAQGAGKDNAAGAHRREPRMSASSLRVEGAAKQFGGLKVFEGISFEVLAGGIMGVIGPNGAGKTTLINCMCGMLPLTARAASCWVSRTSPASPSTRSAGSAWHGVFSRPTPSAASASKRTSFAHSVSGRPRAAGRIWG